MSGVVRKLNNNLLTQNAVSVLGFSGYARMLGNFLWCAPGILQARNFSPLDRAMGQVVDTFEYRGKQFVFDSKYTDELIQDGTYSFGTIREIYIRDCYFRHHPNDVFENAKVVVDLGTNRGIFSVMMAAHADFVLCVEGQSQFEPVIEYNMKRNNFTSYAVEVGIVGTEGDLEVSQENAKTIPQILEKHNIESVDFLKMDIEGSEFSLFQEPAWLSRIRALSMEIHLNYGQLHTVLEPLKQYGFQYVVTDEDLNPMDNPKDVGFVYAWKV